MDVRREAMITLALHGAEVAAAVEEWPAGAPADLEGDGLLRGLLMQVAGAPREKERQAR